MGEDDILKFGKIRKAKFSDIPEIVEIEKVSFQDPWTASMFRSDIKEGKMYVFEVKGKVVGYINFVKAGDEVHITNVAVHPGWRRRGIGRRLLERVIFENPDSYFVLEVRVSNKPAISLYEKLGFRKIYIRKKYYENEDAWVMIRPKMSGKKLVQMQ